MSALLEIFGKRIKLADGSYADVMLDSTEATKGAKIALLGATKQTASSLAKQIFDPGEWDEELINRILPPMAVMCCKAALAQLKVMGVRVGRGIDRKNCGTGDGGFKPGNTCARGGSGSDGDDVTNTPEFKAWFGNSKIVDDAGKPLVMYRGSANPNADAFNDDAMIFLSPNKKFAEDYAKDGGTIHELYVSCQKPFDASRGDGYALWKQYVKETNAPTYAAAGSDRGLLPTWQQEKKLRKWLDEKNVEYDGIYFAENDRSSSLAVLSKNKRAALLGVVSQTQIKSATGNSGKFDPNDPDINKSVKESTATEWLESFDLDDDDAPSLPETYFHTPYGKVGMKISSELPQWMKDKVAEHLDETFSQDYWSGINQTTLDDIHGHLERGLQDGHSIRDMAKNIAKELGGSDYAHVRARNIARTESGNALNGARSLSADGIIAELQEHGLPAKKSWLSVLGTTTRKEHADLDGVPANAEGLWVLVGIKVRWPSDIRLPASQRCNCQCTIIVDFGMDDELAQQLIDDYSTRLAEEEKFTIYLLKDAGSSGANCGTGSGGFQPGNTCAKGGGSVKDATGKYNPGAMGQLAGVDTSKYKKESATMQWVMARIHAFEELAKAGKWDELAVAYKGKTESGKKNIVGMAHANLMKLHGQAVVENKTPAPAVVPPPSPPPVAPPASQWTQKSGQLGTEKGGIYTWSGDGKDYYVKFPDDINRAKNELLALKLYELAGAHAKTGAMIEIDGKPALATEWVEAEKLKWTQGDKVAAAEDFAVHAWLNNRDAVGAGSENPKDNIRLDKSGKLIMLDAGGAMEYKGMGGSGKKDFGHEAAEFDTMRDAKHNPSMADVYGKMTPQQLIDSAQKLKNVSFNDINELVDKYGPGTGAEQAVLINKLWARRNAILDKVAAIEAQQAAKSKPPADTLPDKIEVVPDKPKADPPAGMAVPPPPSYPNSATFQKLYAKKFDLIHEAAKAGDLAKLEAIPTNGAKSAGGYANQAHKYKNDCIAALKSGGSVQPKTETKPEEKPQEKPAEPPPKPVINPDKFPGIPTFASQTTGPGNVAFAQQVLEHAKAGDIDSVKAMAAWMPPSPKLKEWHNGLVENLANQLNPPPPPPKLNAETLDAVISKVKEAKHNGGLEKIGYWNVHSEVQDFDKWGPSNVPQGVKGHGVDDHFWEKGTEAALKAGVKQIAHNYTGNGFTALNDALRFDKKDGYYESIHEKAVKLGQGIVKHGVELPQGLLLKRGYSPYGTYSHTAQDFKPGQVVSEKSNMSVSTEGGFSGIKWHMTVGPGVKGLPVMNYSSHSSEAEVLLAPNQKLLVTKVVGQYEVHAIILPTEPNQCC